MKDLRFVDGPVDCTPEQANYDVQYLEILEDHLRQRILSEDHQAAGYLLSHEGRVFAHRAVGYLRHDDSFTPFRHDSVHRISAMTGVFTVVACYQQIERGRLSLEDQLARFLPELSGTSLGTLTVGHLATHCSGVEAFAMPWVAQHDHPVFQQLQDPQWLRQLALRNAEIRPGERLGYSPMALSVLARIVEVVSNRPFEDYVLSKIARSLGMIDTTFDVTGEARKTMCTIGAEPPIGTRGGAPRGGSGLYSTLMDLHQLANLFVPDSKHPSRSILSPASVAAMTRDHGPRAFVSASSRAHLPPLLPGWLSAREDLLHERCFGAEGWGWSSLHVDPDRRFVCIVFLPGKVEQHDSPTTAARAIAWAGLR